MRKVWLTLSLLLISACSQPAAPPPTGPTVDERISEITRAVLPMVVVDQEPVETTSLEALLDSLGVPGVSVAVFRDGEIEWARGFGKADVEDGRPVTPETLFQAASISKPVAATASLSLVEEGVLDLDEGVNLKLTSWQVPTNEFTEQEPVTLRRLVSHTAGMTVHGFAGYTAGEDVPDTVGVLDGKGNSDPIRVDLLPGSKWRYSGGGYTVMQQLLLDVEGKPFPEIVRDRVLGPAGMMLSTYEQPLPESRAAEAASAHGALGDQIEGKWHTYPEMAAAGLWTTPSDLARFAIAIQKSYAGEPGALLSQDMARQMLTPGLNNHGLGPSIGADGQTFGHGGSNRGFRCNFTASVDGSWGIAVMTNGARGAVVSSRLMMTIAQSYGWPLDLKPVVRELVEVGDEALNLLAGKYEIEGMGVLTFEPERGRLFADVPRQGRLEFLPRSEMEVVQRDDGRVITFVLENGEITGFTSPGITGRRID